MKYLEPGHVCSAHLTHQGPKLSPSHDGDPTPNSRGFKERGAGAPSSSPKAQTHGRRVQGSRDPQWKSPVELLTPWQPGSGLPGHDPPPPSKPQLASMYSPEHTMDKSLMQSPSTNTHMCTHTHTHACICGHVKSSSSRNNLHHGCELGKGVCRGKRGFSTSGP